MTAFTRLGSGIWDWEPWTELDETTRLFWLALYTSSEAKRHAPGLWQGGIPAMADAARMAADNVIRALDRLLERGLVEHDPKNRVLRMCALPDAGEFPSNGKVILSWWTRFKSVPECGVRDAHITLLRWIIDEGSKQRGEALTPNHESAWTSTFGKVAIPVPRHRGVRRLADSDTGTNAQPSLFASAPLLLAATMPSGNGMPISDASGYPQGVGRSVDNSAVLRHLNNINPPETVSDTVSDTNRIPDPGSRIPESSSLSGEGDRGRGLEVGAGVRPVLTLVPPYTTADILRALASGDWDPAFDKSHQNALGAMIPAWVASGVTLADFALLADYNAHAHRRWNARLLVGSDLLEEIACARKTLDWRDARVAMLRETLP